ncbi:unnamed protein product [Victoria cruziana]
MMEIHVKGLTSIFSANEV